MVAINFQQRFAHLVETGAKRQTIRLLNRYKVGGRLQLYTGMRTKACRKLGEGVCQSVDPVTITRKGIWLADIPSDAFDLDALAVNDGFKNFHEMAGWFQDHHGLPFDGYLIRWDLAPTVAG